jgi:transcriptional regulator with XRE-family HTH domain
VKHLAAALKAWRLRKGYDMRTAAKKIGIPLSTYYRVEAGKSMQDHTLSRILIWLFVEEE